MAGSEALTVSTARTPTPRAQPDATSDATPHPPTIPLLPSRAMKSVTVSAAILVEGGKVLLTQRKAGAHLEGAWEFPGGKVEPGEDPREALRRELSEELGLDCDVGEIVDVAFHRYEEVEKAITLLFFEASRREGSPEPRALDVAAFQWAEVGALDPAAFPPADVAVLAKVRTRLAAP